MRKQQTPAEKVLWKKLRGKKLAGLKFLRQHPLFYTVDAQKKFFIVDFYCDATKLVIEVDGEIHKSQVDYDIHRDSYISATGIKVLRVTNDEIENDLDDVLGRILAEVRS